MLESRMKSIERTQTLLYSLYSTVDETAIHIRVFQQAALILRTAKGNSHHSAGEVGEGLYNFHTFALLYTTSVGLLLAKIIMRPWLKVRPGLSSAITPIPPCLKLLSVTLPIFCWFTYSVKVLPITSTATRLVWFSP